MAAQSKAVAGKAKEQSEYVLRTLGKSEVHQLAQSETDQTMSQNREEPATSSGLPSSRFREHSRRDWATREWSCEYLRINAVSYSAEASTISLLIWSKKNPDYLAS